MRDTPRFRTLRRFQLECRTRPQVVAVSFGISADLQSPSFPRRRESRLQIVADASRGKTGSRAGTTEVLYGGGFQKMVPCQMTPLPSTFASGSVPVWEVAPPFREALAGLKPGATSEIGHSLHKQGGVKVGPFRKPPHPARSPRHPLPRGERAVVVFGLTLPPLAGEGARQRRAGEGARGPSTSSTDFDATLAS